MIASDKWVAPEDYKVYCFHGEPKYIMVCIGRENGGHPKFYYFDTDWNITKLSKDGLEAPKDLKIEKPQCLDKLLSYAAKLSKPFPFVRADFYVVENDIYFGELTFTPSGGLDSARLKETDILLGSMIDINKTNINFGGTNNE